MSMDDGIPTICLWETALLVRKGKLELDLRVGDWARSILGIPRARELPLDATTAVRADGLEMHPDPADRFVVATALQHDAVLVTGDEWLARLASASIQTSSSPKRGSAGVMKPSPSPSSSASASKPFEANGPPASSWPPADQLPIHEVTKSTPRVDHYSIAGVDQFQSATSTNR